MSCTYWRLALCRHTIPLPLPHRLQSPSLHRTAACTQPQARLPANPNVSARLSTTCHVIRGQTALRCLVCATDDICPPVDERKDGSHNGKALVVKTEVKTGKDAATPPTSKKIQKNKKRCWSCRKKVGLMGFECKCSYVFCAEHRYAEAHTCTYDYMTEQRAKLKQDNPTIEADKLTRI